MLGKFSQRNMRMLLFQLQSQKPALKKEVFSIQLQFDDSKQSVHFTVETLSIQTFYDLSNILLFTLIFCFLYFTLHLITINI